MKWEIRYYLTETAYKCGAFAFKENIIGDRNFVINWAQNRIKYSSYKFYDFIQK